jgi:iron complex outermembrane receptor protein
VRMTAWLFCLCTTSALVAQTAPPSGQANAHQPPPVAPETVVVTGTFAPVPETETDRSVDVIESDGQGVLFQSWVDYLQLDPSVNLRQRAAANVQGDLSIRGSTFGQTLVLIDGLRMNDPQTGHHDMDLPVPTDSVQRIEVLRGAGSTLYGSDAMAGTINVITRRPEHSDVRIGAGAGNFGVNEESGSVSLLWKKFDQEIFGERAFSSGFRPDRDYRNSSLFSSTGARTALGRTRVLLGYGDKPYGADQFYGPFDSWERTKSWFAGVAQQLGANTEFDFAFRRHTDEFVLFRDKPAIYENNHVAKSWQAGLRRRQALSQNSTLFFGGEGIHESIQSNNLGDHSRSRGAVYLDYDVRAFKRFSFSAGAREEILSASHGEFSPTVAAGVWIKPSFKLKGSASRAFRLPTYTDLYYHDPANFGNPGLRPERAWDFEGGLLWNPGLRLKSELTVFQRRDRDVIDYVRASPAAPYVAENIQRFNFTGVEASSTLQISENQRLQVSYTRLYGVQDSLGALLTKYSFNYPVHDAVVGWNGMLPGKLVARTRVGIIDRYATDPYGLWDVAVAREFSHVGAHLSFANITDTQYQEIAGVVMPGRSVIVGVDLFWHARMR